MKKKTMLLFSICVIVLLLLTGCGNRAEVASEKLLKAIHSNATVTITNNDEDNVVYADVLLPDLYAVYKRLQEGVDGEDISVERLLKEVKKNIDQVEKTTISLQVRLEIEDINDVDHSVLIDQAIREQLDDIFIEQLSKEDAIYLDWEKENER